MRRNSEAAAAIRTLLSQRRKVATVCPSEAARLIAGPGGEWRALMEPVHAAVDAMHEAGEITLSWKGKRLARRSGAYRIALPGEPPE
ncbi:hypothetical protein NAP1_10118 [Erythrobacter sp. NAP1]|uniref:DUF3253 domain-containing protein n=1 Tax=Erythrobacter sp. NAP1 TaxID=237727 RepID=UPI0000687832|nr:DUF3253 domain-containing protein [Erythrobacter sp. NAP1]EAQ27941.1 hypothetical protein NAP1_10118 [Erythrobacter sp. NAP1]